jgi:hypothetical protein
MLSVHLIPRLVRFILLAGFLASAVSQAASYGVFCFVGDSISYATRPTATGTRIASGRTEARAQDGDDFDRICRAAVVEAVKKSAPAARVTMLRLPKDVAAPYYALDASKNTQDEFARRLRSLSSALANDPEPARAIVVTKLTRRHWSEPMSRAGLGFYSNFITLDSGEPGPAMSQQVRQYVAPFVRLQVSMVDAKTGRLIGSRDIATHQEIEPKETGNRDSAWDALPPKEMAATLGRIMVDELERVTGTWVAELAATR